MSFLNLWNKNKKEIVGKSKQATECQENNKVEISKFIDSCLPKEAKEDNNVNNPLIKLKETELRDLCRHHIDTFEN